MVDHQQHQHQFAEILKNSFLKTSGGYNICLTLDTKLFSRHEKREKTRQTRKLFFLLANKLRNLNRS